MVKLYELPVLLVGAVGVYLLGQQVAHMFLQAVAPLQAIIH